MPPAPIEPTASVKGQIATGLTTEKLCPGLIALGVEVPLPTCASALAGAVPPTWLVAVVCTELTLPKLVCAVACACPLEPLAVDCAVAK